MPAAVDTARYDMQLGL